jgi:NDP-sugar pyrophosphorylase family protein
VEVVVGATVEVGAMTSVVDVVGTTVVVDDVVVLDVVVVGRSVVVVDEVVGDHASKSRTSSYTPSPQLGVDPNPNWLQQYPARSV